MTRHYRIGLIGLATLCVVASLVAAASGLAVGERTYTAQLEHTAGLRIGEEVQVAGVGVGEVTDISLAGGDHVDVEFTVDDDIHLGDKTVAEVKVATLLGTHLLMVQPIGEGELADATVPVDQTRVPFNLQDVLDVGQPELEEVDAEEIERSLGQLAQVLGRSGDDLGPALDGVQALSDLVATRSEGLGRLLVAARRVTRQLNQSSGDVLAMMRQADLILDALRTRRETIHALLQDLQVFGQQIAGVIEDTEGDLAPTLRDIQTVSDLLQKHKTALSRALEVLGPAARYFANGAGTGPWLDQYTVGGTPDNVNCVEELSCG